MEPSNLKSTSFSATSNGAAKTGIAKVGTSPLGVTDRMIDFALSDQFKMVAVVVGQHRAANPNGRSEFRFDRAANFQPILGNQ